MEESIFKFKKAKKMVGNFDPDDKNEWTLLIKPQIGDATLFIHYHKLWLIQEQPEIEADPDNGVEGQKEIKRQSSYELFRGFVKDGKFVIEKQSQFSAKVDEAISRKFLDSLQTHIDFGYDKDWNMYSNDIAEVPSYYEYPKGSAGNMPGNMMNMMQAQAGMSNPLVQASTNGVRRSAMLTSGSAQQSNP